MNWLLVCCWRGTFRHWGQLVLCLSDTLCETNLYNFLDTILVKQDSEFPNSTSSSQRTTSPILFMNIHTSFSIFAIQAVSNRAAYVIQLLFLIKKICFLHRHAVRHTHTYRVIPLPSTFVCLLIQMSLQFNSSLTFQVIYTSEVSQVFLQAHLSMRAICVIRKQSPWKEGQDNTLEYLAIPLCFRREREDLAMQLNA